jgi:hypothetical protein
MGSKTMLDTNEDKVKKIKVIQENEKIMNMIE